MILLGVILIISLIVNWIVIGYIVHLNLNDEVTLGFVDLVCEILYFKFDIAVWPLIIYDEWYRRRNL